MAYILRREDLRGNGSSPQGFQPILGLFFSRFKLYAVPMIHRDVAMQRPYTHFQAYPNSIATRRRNILRLHISPLLLPLPLPPLPLYSDL